MDFLRLPRPLAPGILTNPPGVYLRAESPIPKTTREHCRANLGNLWLPQAASDRGVGECGKLPLFLSSVDRGLTDACDRRALARRCNRASRCRLLFRSGQPNTDAMTTAD